MSKQRMRYQWFQDVPRNVTRREYQQLQFSYMAALGFGIAAMMLFVAVVTGMTLQTSRELEDTEELTLAEALDYEGDRLDLVKVEGFVVADDPPTMPDDETREIIRGELTITARPPADSGTEDNPPQEVVLYDWAAAAEPVYLAESEQRRLPLAFDLSVLPMQAEPGPIEAETVRVGDSARTNRPVAVQFGDETLPLPLEAWGEIDTVSTDLSRQVLPYGESVVVIAALESTPNGPQLVDPLGDRLQVHIGTEADIRASGQRLRIVFGLLAIAFSVASFFIARSALQVRQEFIHRSNQ
ncbi:hypothetical protein [Leptolyngbya iicbica]|uniref:Uncharacterized protein n=2 Tax=Cyanophyceae TaxID=3028117 RepID=A0A4Q7E2S6_9CYAN|nr:hypothetical protein [Leptolyngbya sp. LK]RZM75360.1 hypothetical protein DYY88_20690 [Leptolyngbya sp. LK]